MVLGLGKQKLVTVSPVAEGLVNLTCSILLARRYGAVGIAYGTLIGAFVGLGIHILYSMRLTNSVLAVSRTRLVLQSFIRPSTVALPALLLAPYWMRLQTLNWTMVTAVLSGTAALLYFVALNSQDRHQIWGFIRRDRQPNIVFTS
jgi:O-antigen/teichoic acid export membrane protein